MAWSLNAGTVTKLSVKATPGNVFALRVTNVNAAARWFQLHNKASAPAAGETAQLYFPIPAGSATVPGVLEVSGSFLFGGEPFTTGVGWAISTTADTFTDSATANEHTTVLRYG